MAHLRVVCKALKINKLKTELAKEKVNSLQIQHGEVPKLTCGQKCRHCCIDCRLKLKKCCSLPKSSRLARFWFKLTHEGSFEHFLVKSLLGFLGGFLLTYLLFLFLVVQLSFKLSIATFICVALGAFLMIGLAFSRSIRCIVFLTLPQFFSRRGRQALLAYALILTITGPAKNALNNMGILSESLACGQEQLKAAVRQIVDVVKKPFYAIRDAIKSVVKTVKVIVRKIKEILLKIKRLIMALLGVIKSAFQFLGKILNICNKELGTPFQRCSRVFENAITDCNAKLGPLFNWLCSITYIVKSVCYIVKVFDYVCMLVDFVSDSVIGVVVRKVKTFVRHIRTMFYVRIKFSHSFKFQSNSSKTYSQVAFGIVGEVKERTQLVAAVFDLMSLVTSFFLIMIVLKAIYYRYKFLTKERFDNNYITKDFRLIDLQRAKFGKETVLPLNHRERKVYVSIQSWRLVKTEKKRLANSAVILLTASIKIAGLIAADYCLFWILDLVRYYGRFQSKVPAPNMPTVRIEGHGLLADLLKSIVNAFRPLGMELEIDTVPCLPEPIPPNYDRYVQIVLCWILLLLEPYGLRLRNRIMSYYHPLRAKERSVWLYNHVMRSRSSFLKFARRLLRRNVMGDKQLTKITCKEFLRAKLRICRICLGSDHQNSCLLCGETFRKGDDVKAIKCQTPDCPGIYCEQCFSDIQNLCTACLSPIEYGDFSDISEEKGSDDEEAPRKRKLREGVVEENVIRGEIEKVEDGKNVANFKEESGGVSDSSSNHSYSYQYKKREELSSGGYTNGFRDIEKQNIPDFVSMATFRDIEEEIRTTGAKSRKSTKSGRGLEETFQEETIFMENQETTKFGRKRDIDKKSKEEMLLLEDFAAPKSVRRGWRSGKSEEEMPLLEDQESPKLPRRRGNKRKLGSRSEEETPLLVDQETMTAYKRSVGTSAHKFRFSF